jgi:hypothetical protein
MAVNPNLATLMRVIEEAQSKIPEGEYLAAMNALGALHRVVVVPAPAPAPVAVVPAPVAVVPVPAPVAVAQRRPWSVPYTREECAWFLARIDCEAAPFVAELKEQNEIIELKVKGAIRNAQKRRKELVEVLKNLNYKRSRYYNGGVA